MKDVSVIVPVYNSAKTLETLADGIVEFFKQYDASLSFEILLVDDCSGDTSWDSIVQLQKKYPKIVRGFSLERNFGQHAATFCGLKHSEGKCAVTIDDDLQVHPNSIELLFNSSPVFSAVYGVYPNKKHAAIRNLGSQLLRATIAFVSKTSKKGSSFRLIRNSILVQIKKHHHTFVHIDELISSHTSNIGFVDVDHQTRAGGKSQYSLMSLLFSGLDILLFKTDASIKFITFTGITFSFLSFVAAFFYLLVYFVYDVPVQGYTSIIVSLFFLSGLILLSLGVIGEFIRKIFLSVNQSPPFSIKKRV